MFNKQYNLFSIILCVAQVKVWRNHTKKFGNLEILKMARIAQHINKPEIIFHLKIIL